MLKTPNLKLYMPFEGDFTEKANNYTVDVGATPPTIVNGQRGKAVDFSSSSDQYLYVNTTDFSLADSVPFTACFNYYPRTSDTVYQGLFGHGLSSGFGFFATSAGTTVVFRALGSAVYQVQAAGFTPNQWNHVVGVYNGTRLKLYKNANLVGTVSCPSYKKGVYGIGIGKLPDRGMFAGTNYNSNSALDDVQIYWDKVLSDEDIQRVYLGMHPLNG